jgi:ATP-dependent DNA helicase DinG
MSHPPAESGADHLTPAGVLGPGGLVSRRLASFESRPQQLQMADAVAAAIAKKSHLIVEAGTGVGKSFAYLVPAVLAAAERPEEEGKGKTVVVSTHTISLQEQLIARDIPFLNSVLPVEFSAVLAKGRSNYVSLRRLKGAGERARSMFGEPQEVEHLRQLKDWAKGTNDGSLGDLDFRPLPQVWDEVKSDHGNCLGRKCPTYNECHFYKARRRVWNADVIVVNHALFFSDLALRREGASVLPDYDVVILDEAHTLEQVAGEHLGVSVTNGQVLYALGKLFNESKQKGLLVHHDVPRGQEMVIRLRHLAGSFFETAQAWYERQQPGNGRAREPLGLSNPLGAELRKLAVDLRTHSTGIKAEEQKIELTSAADRLDGLSGSIDCWLKQTLADSVYWVEVSGRQRQTVRLVCAPIDVGPVLRDELFAEVDTAILTSATLSVGKGDFQFFRQRIGLTGGAELKLGSPFNYREQVRLVLADRMPDPNDAAYEAAACERIRRHVGETEGGTFVLFTSYRMLQSCAKRLTPWFAERGVMLLCQGEGLERSAMLERFRRDGRAVLFGTESFWQGVDVPGDALQNVIITKLPFSVPDHPLLEARLDQIKENGGMPFMDYQVPEAAIKLRQGFGRLIRSKSDTGQVVILDPRVRTKRYGKLFLESLPECRVVVDNGKG